MIREQLISKYHLDQNRALHDAPKDYGASGFKWGDMVRNLLYSFHIETILDYGCGGCTLERSVFRNWRDRQGLPHRHGMKWYNYDPAIKARSSIKLKKYDLVVSTDVLEHVEPDKIDNVLKHIFSLAGTCVFLVIALNLANKSYPDGKNTHLIVKPSGWWIEKIKTKTKWNVTRIAVSRMHKDLVLEITP